MTHTTTRPEIHHPAPRTSSSLGSSGKQRLLWISLYWIMLLLVGEGLIPSAGDTTVLGRRVSFDAFGLSLSINMFLWLL
jgi:hypothetical protein